MENIQEKLKILRFEKNYVKGMKERQVGRDQFSIPATNLALQYNHYVGLFRWLVSVIEEGSDFDLDEFDDPNIIAQKLMMKLRDLGFEIDFPIAKLKQSYGSITCSIVDFLADKALQRSDYILQDPIYKSKSSEENENGVSEVGTELIEMNCDSSEDEESSVGIIPCDDALSSEEEKSDVMKSLVDPVAWSVELKKVAPSLNVQFKCNEDWREHVKRIRLETQNMLRELNASNDALDKLNKDSSSIMQKIFLKEGIINDRFREVIDQFMVVRQQVNSLEISRNESKSSIEKLAIDLEKTTSDLKEVKSRVDEKGTSMTDTSPLVQIKTTLQQIKSEIREYDIKIGVLENTLLQKRLMSATREKVDRDIDASFEMD
jgi:estrogen-related receptor beta like 1